MSETTEPAKELALILSSHPSGIFIGEEFTKTTSPRSMFPGITQNIEYLLKDIINNPTPLNIAYAPYERIRFQALKAIKNKRIPIIITPEKLSSRDEIFLNLFKDYSPIHIKYKLNTPAKSTIMKSAVNSIFTRSSSYYTHPIMPKGKYHFYENS